MYRSDLIGFSMIRSQVISLYKTSTGWSIIKHYTMQSNLAHNRWGNTSWLSLFQASTGWFITKHYKMKGILVHNKLTEYYAMIPNEWSCFQRDQLLPAPVKKERIFFLEKKRSDRWNLDKSKLTNSCQITYVAPKEEVKKQHIEQSENHSQRYSLCHIDISNDSDFIFLLNRFLQHDAWSWTAEDGAGCADPGLLTLQYRTHSEDPHPAGAALFTLSSSSHGFRLVTLLGEIITILFKGTLTANICLFHFLNNRGRCSIGCWTAGHLGPVSSTGTHYCYQKTGLNGRRMWISESSIVNTF